MKEKYVVSEDIRVLLAEWAAERDFALPPEEFFEQLRKEMKEFLEGIFEDARVDMISAAELSNGMQEFIDSIGLPAVSMDRAYIRTNPAIQITRIVDKSLNERDIGPRFGSPPIQQQLDTVKQSYDEIVLVDDVIFSGEVIKKIILDLREIEVKVPTIVTGITIREGVETLRRAKINSKILTVRCYEEIIDEICERDFYPGVPLSGRLIAGMKIETGAPYLLPFGNPIKWASIPEEWAEEFSAFCLKQTFKLWEKIECLSDKTVSHWNLERIPFGFSRNNSCLLDTLKSFF